MHLTLLQRVLKKITEFQIRRPVWIVCAALILTALSIDYSVWNLEFQTGQMDLLSPKDPLVKLTKQIARFDALDTFIVVIENRNTGRSLEFLKQLVPRLQANRRQFRHVFSRVDPEAFMPWALLYLDREALLDIRENLQERRPLLENLARSPSLANFFEAVDHEMTSAMVGELFTGFLHEPAGEQKKNPVDLSLLLTTLKSMKEGLDQKGSFKSPWEDLMKQGGWNDPSEEGYFWTEGKRYLLVFVTPNKDEEGFSDTLQPLKTLRGALSGLKLEFPDIEAGVTGMEALNADEMGLAFTDMSIATLVSVAGLIILLVLFWRGLRRPLLEMAALLVALSLTFGLTTLFIGHLNILSITFAPLLLGLGIDYGVHWFARFQEEEQCRGVSSAEVIQNTMIRIGPGVALAGMTAALSFVPLAFTGFKGLEELGTIAAMGMAVTTIITLGLLPPLALLFGQTGARVSSVQGRTRALLNLKGRAGFLILAAGLLAVLLSIWGAAGVNFDLNMLHLQSRKAESVIWERKLIHGSERSSMYGAILADSIPQLKEKSDALKKLRTVAEVQSVLTLLPEDQERKIGILKETAALIPAFGPPRGRMDLAELSAVLGKIRFKMMEGARSSRVKNDPLGEQMAQVGALIDSLQQTISASEPSKTAGRLEEFERSLMSDLEAKLDFIRKTAQGKPMEISDLPRPLLQRFVDEHHRYLIRVFPNVDVWDPAHLGRFVEELRSVDVEARGDPVTLFVFTRAFRDAALKAAVYALLCVSAVLLLTFRNLTSAFLAITPLLAGTMWTLGLMGLFDVHFNLANAVFLPLVVGAGVEYGIIIMQRRREELEKRNDVVLPRSTGKGVILSGLTTTVGFGSLTVSSHQGISSLGLLATVGSLSMLAAAVIFLPAVLQSVPKRKEDNPS